MSKSQYNRPEKECLKKFESLKYKERERHCRTNEIDI